MVFGTSIHDETVYKVRHPPTLSHARFSLSPSLSPSHPFYSACLDRRAQAWSRIVHTAISNAAVLSKHLTTFAQVCSATEAILFDRTTSLVIATSAPPDDGP